MNIELKGRRAIVTGSTAGIGRATAEGLARAGASVVINGRGNARVDEAVRQMRQHFPESDISGIAADLSTAEGAEAFFAQAPDADILVNNLGTAVLRDFVDTTDEDWLSIFQINVMSGVRVTRHYLPRMVRQGWGRVVFVSSEFRSQHPQGDDRLRDDEYGAARGLPRSGRVGRGHGRYRQCCPPRSDEIRDPIELDGGASQGPGNHAGRSRASVPEKRPARRALSGVSRRPTRSPT